MTDPVFLNNLTLGIRALSHADPSEIEFSVEKYLEHELRDVAWEERMVILDGLTRIFGAAVPKEQHTSDLMREDAERFISQLLGKKVAAADLSPAEIAEKFAFALDTVFTTLNQIIGVINVTLLGQESEVDTIRQIIGSQVAGEIQDVSIKEYLEQIQQAFLTAHTAFQQAAHTVVNEMLFALNPETLENSTKSGIKFGPLRKAELYDSYSDKYQECKSWFESGRFSEKMLREFEKICLKKINVKNGHI